MPGVSNLNDILAFDRSTGPQSGRTGGIQAGLDCGAKHSGYPAFPHAFGITLRIRLVYPLIFCSPAARQYL
jgi:hypothetical protein